LQPRRCSNETLAQKQRRYRRRSCHDHSHRLRHPFIQLVKNEYGMFIYRVKFIPIGDKSLPRESKPKIFPFRYPRPIPVMKTVMIVVPSSWEWKKNDTIGTRLALL
jgi:hypothetical protein